MIYFTSKLIVSRSYNGLFGFMEFHKCTTCQTVNHEAATCLEML